MPGNITQFVDFQTSSGDTGESNDASIQPIVNGELVNATVQGRVDQNLRRRTEALRATVADSAYLRDADRALIIAGPGKVTWPGSTTASQSGILTLTDVLWILPMLTPGFAQTTPIPPVASVFGTLHLKRASGNADAILVTSQRRGYADGDRINATVTAGASFSCVLDVEDAGTYRRTIKVVATPSTTLGTVISALNGLTPPAPDNTQLVTAALEGGALSGDVILSPQARQFASGNYDGEGHALTPANLASFFSSNPSEVLAEGDTLCAQFATLVDTASTGGRRQAVPENSNTSITVGMLFNSRVHPEKLVNALPICKVIAGRLVFVTGAQIPAGAVAADPGGSASIITYNGGGAWFDGTTNPATTVEGQLDKIITDLGGAGGAVKIGIAALSAWADAVTNPSVSVQAQLAKIISDLAGAAGTAKIQGVANGTDLVVGTLKAQLDNLSTNWLKMSRANVIAAAQTFTQLITANGGLTAGTNQHVTVGGTGEYKHAGETITFGGFAVVSGTAITNLSGDVISSSACTLVATIPLKVGDRVTSITVTFDGAGTVDVTEFSVYRITNNGTMVPLGTTTVTDVSGPIPTTIDLTDTTLAVNEKFIVYVAINATGCTVRNPAATFTHP